jgi:alkanesulfonate monooxygenase SsuD/methylene tetrahydromethanopterin reductase-like flavin-dependent oxidoreductase (luciferase family)
MHMPISSMRMAEKMRSPSIIASSSRRDRSNRNRETTLAVWAICAETGAEANILASSFKMLILCLQRGELIPVPSPQKAAQFLAEGVGWPGSSPMQRRIIAGTPEVVKDGIEALAEEYEADEVLIVNIVYDHSARKRSYQLVADAFGLVGA